MVCFLVVDWFAGLGKNLRMAGVALIIQPFIVLAMSVGDVAVLGLK
jgi:hypothetical protein